MNLDGRVLRTVTGSIFENDSRWEAFGEGPGTGLAFTFKYEPLGIVTSNETFLMSCYGTNSNVNEPGSAAGSTGGAFNIYGNLVLVSGPNPVLSFSYPWGVSVSGAQSSGISCKTNMTALLYR